jgi:hypothetical protein
MLCGFFDGVANPEGSHEAPYVRLSPGFAVVGIFHRRSLAPGLGSIEVFPRLFCKIFGLSQAQYPVGVE